MSQSDFGTINPSTKSGTQLATNLNEWRDALHSGHSGNARPSYAAAGMVWVKTVSETVHELYYYDGTDDILVGSVDLTNNLFTPALQQDLYIPAGKNIVFEGATDDANEATLTTADPTADRTHTLPDASGTVAHKSGSASPGETIVVAVSDESTAITTGTAKVTFRMPFAMTLTAVRATLSTASSSGTPTFDINEGGVSILSTKITIDANEKTSTTAATPPVISDASLADDAEITIDIDVAGTGAKGAKVCLIGYRT